MANFFHLMKKDLHSITRLHKSLTKPSITLRVRPRSVIIIYIFSTTKQNHQPAINMSIKLWDKTFDSLRQIMKENLLIKKAFV